MDKLSLKQQEVYDFLVEKMKKYGYPPSIREICQGVGVKSTSTIHGHLSKLEEKGYIKRDSSKKRAIELLVKNKEAKENTFPTSMSVESIPMVGRVAAGSPILAEENIEDYFTIPTSHLGQGEHFMLRISGDSMIEAGIFDHDYVLVQRTSDARNGECIIALLDDSATCKTFYREKDHIRLQPENSSYDPIITKDVQIIGKVKGVFRFL